jgi:hypothetical protein
MCSFILQTLSSDRTFSVKLNKTFEGHASLPTSVRIPNFQGSYADFLILVTKAALKEIGSLLIHLIDNFLADCFFERLFIYFISSTGQDNH